MIFTRDNRNAQDFTTERSRLRAAIDRFMPGVVYGLPGTNERADSYSFISSLQTLNRVTDYLGTVPQRRKTIFYVSPGVPVDMQEASSVVLIGPGTSMADHDLALDLVDALRDTERAQSRYAYGMRDALVRAQHGNVNIYSIDPGGLGGLQFFLQNRTSAGAPVEPPVASMQKASLHREYLKTVANNSGGRAIVDTNDLASAVAGIFRENSAYYLLGYRSTRGPDDRKVRQVDVRVNRREVTAQTRNAYYDPRARPAAIAPDPALRLTNALAGILPTPELALRASVAPFAMPGRKTAGLAIVLGIRQPIPSGDIGARVTETVELLTGAFTPVGEDRGNFRQTAQIRMRVGCGRCRRVRPALADRAAARPLSTAARRAQHGHRQERQHLLRRRGAGLRGRAPPDVGARARCDAGSARGARRRRDRPDADRADQPARVRAAQTRCEASFRCTPAAGCRPFRSP